jgi:hypothetical protein
MESHLREAAIVRHSRPILQISISAMGQLACRKIERQGFSE